MPTKAPSTPFGRGPRWTEREARDALAALRHSGKPVSVFAAEQGLDPQRLYSWRRRLGKAEPNTFQEVIVRRSAPVAMVREDAAFEVALPSGITVRVPASFDAAALERLLEVLQARAC